MMNVLMLSWDSSAVQPDEVKTKEDFRDRLIEYGKLVNQLVVIAYTPRSMRATPRTLSRNVQVYPTNSWHKFTYPMDAWRVGRRLVQTQKIDIITTQDPMLTGIAGWWLAGGKRRYISLHVQVRGDYIDNPAWLKTRPLKVNYVLNTLGRWVLRRSDTVRVLNQRVKQYLAQTLNLTEMRIFVVPPLVNLDRFLSPVDGTLLRARWGDWQQVVMFVGRLTPEKNLPCLLRAAKKVVAQDPHILFLIVGHGPEKPELERLAREMGITQNIRFAGLVGHADLPAYYAACDLLVLPSFHEGWGKVAAEALLCQRPVIMSRVGCADELVVDGETGYVVPVNNCEALAARILDLCRNPSLRMEMGRRGRERVMQLHNRERNLEQNRQVYEQTLALWGTQ